MNRRSFFKSLARAAMVAAALRYAPQVLVEVEPGVENLTLMEWAQRTDPDGGVAILADLLAQPNDILADLVFTATPEDGPHRVAIRTPLPEVNWR